MFVDIKSAHSKKVFPAMVASFNGPNDKVVKTPKILAAIVASTVASQRFILNSSVTKRTITSNNDIEDVSAAITKRMKNISEKKVPPGIFANISGKTTKTRPVPSSGDIPNENIAGNIATPSESQLTDL